jgi:hypothetical protein
LKFQIRKRGGRPIEVQPEFTQVGENVVIGSTAGRERFQVLMLRDGRIVDMQGFARRREAERFARRSAARG